MSGSVNGNVAVLILGGGQGKRLYPLTGYRSKPAVPIGGKYRLVDIPISNAINSGLRRIFVLTQFNSTSLHRHIGRTYPYEGFTQTSVELLAAEQTIAHADWFQGTADAVRKHLPHYHLEVIDTVLVLSGDHLYRMDYREILNYHRERGADMTVATVPVSKKWVDQFGIMQIRSDGHISAFREKPSKSENIKSFVIPENIRNTFHVKGEKEQYLASMGIYVFKPQVLVEALAGKEVDFGKEVIPKALGKYKTYGFVFNGYWRDIGTIHSFFQANLELTKPDPKFSFLMPENRIFSRPRFLPPNKISGARLKDVLISEGCVIDNSSISNSVIGLRAVIRGKCKINRSIIMGNDYYKWTDSALSNEIGIGKNCIIENAILDKNVVVGDNVWIRNKEGIQEKDGENYYIRDGIVIVPKGVTIPEGTKI